jgi:hypothetical protein
MTDIKKAFQPLKGDTEKSLSSKHQIEVLNRNPAPKAEATTPSADTSGNASAKEGKK